MRNQAKSASGKVGVIQSAQHAVTLIVLIVTAALPGFSQSNPDLQTFFRQEIGLSQAQVAAIQNGQGVTKALPSRTPAEVFLFGAVYIHAAPQSYLQFAHDFERLRKLPSYLALGVAMTTKSNPVST